jgi:hypothetical protein
MIAAGIVRRAPRPRRTVPVDLDPMTPTSPPPLHAAALRRAAQAAAAGLLALLGACATRAPEPQAPAGPSPSQVRARIAQLLPASLQDRPGWAADLYAAFAVLQVPPTPDNLCAVLAVTEQESGYRVDPPVPGLAAIAWKEIDARAERAGVPRLLVRGALELRSSDGATYRERIDAARTERELSRIFEDFVGMVPLGAKLFGGWNPVRTAGPMQVSIAFAEQHAAQRPYPYPLTGSMRHEVFTRRGGLYFGTAHLFDYRAPYARLLFRYADFNAGRYASRNAAFQNAVSVASGIPLALDGDLVRPGSDADDSPGSTELATRVLAHRLGMDAVAIRRALELGETEEFERHRLYGGVFALADAAEGKAVPRALVPTIPLRGPKISRSLTTEWFARRVEERQVKCLARDAALPH